MTAIMDFSAAASARTSIFHPEHPLHHVALDLVEQFDQALEQWLATVVPNRAGGEQIVPERHLTQAGKVVSAG